MNSKREVKDILISLGHPELFTEENYRIATAMTTYAAKQNKELGGFFKILEGTRERYKVDLIIKNKLKLV